MMMMILHPRETRLTAISRPIRRYRPPAGRAIDRIDLTHPAAAEAEAAAPKKKEGERPRKWSAADPDAACIAVGVPFSGKVVLSSEWMMMEKQGRGSKWCSNK